MKSRFFRFIQAVVLATAGTLVAQAASPEKASPQAEPNKTAPAEKPVPKSTFGVPAKPVEGRDPFFPTSDRLFADKTAPRHAAVSPSAALVFNGISGTQDHRLAMINGYTFAEGEVALVNTAGGRVSVRCLEIKGELVVVEVAGERRELRFQNR